MSFKNWPYREDVYDMDSETLRGLSRGLEAELEAMAGPSLKQ
jgi:hypothetical protein